MAIECTEFCQALADDTRQRILEMLLEKEMCVGDIVAAFDTSQPTISHHLNILKRFDLVTSRKEGRQAYYTQAVREAYGAAVRRFIAEPAQASCGCRTCQAEPGSPGPSESAAGTQDTAVILHSVEELDELEDRVPNVAEIQPGEVVLDLGSGAGADCLLAARKVGPEGRVIGLDMTPEMIKLSRRNARNAGVTNVEFRYGEMEDIPLPDGSVDLVISSCVFNLSPDKDAVFGEAYRMLRPGGRMVVSDIVIDGELPQPVRESLVAWAGCVAGALEESDYVDKIRAAGFTEVEVLARETVKISEAPAWKLARAALAQAGLPPDTLDRTVISASVKARKPA